MYALRRLLISLIDYPPNCRVAQSCRRDVVSAGHVVTRWPTR
jgi:hypothetical protein